MNNISEFEKSHILISRTVYYILCEELIILKSRQHKSKSNIQVFVIENGNNIEISKIIIFFSIDNASHQRELTNYNLADVL